jgi:hypothetical protein
VYAAIVYTWLGLANSNYTKWRNTIRTAPNSVVPLGVIFHQWFLLT